MSTQTTIVMTSHAKMDKNYGAAEHYATCCTGPFRTNIQEATYVIAFLGLVLNLIDVLAAFLLDSAVLPHGTLVGVLGILGVLVYLSVIEAQRERKHQLFLPYLIFMGVKLGIMVAAGIFCLFAVIAPTQATVDVWNKEHPGMQMSVEQFRDMMLKYLIIFGLYLALNGWFYSIIFRAYKHAKHNIGIGGSRVPPPV